MFNPVAPYRYLLLNLYLYVADIANPDLLACGSRTWISLDIDRFYAEHFQPSSGSAWPACQKNGNRAPIAGGGRGRHNLDGGLPDSSTAFRLCRLEPQSTYTSTATITTKLQTLYYTYITLEQHSPEQPLVTAPNQNKQKPHPI